MEIFQRWFGLKKILFLTCLAALTLTVYFATHGNPYKIAQVDRDVKHYLNHDRGYKPEDIKSIKGSYEYMKGTGYMAAVIFVDEPEDKYFYYYNKTNGKIMQDGYVFGAKHIEKK